MAAIIEMENICKTYRSGENAVEALRNVSLTVEEGEFLSIVGNSGSGKSTLMNILGCLDLPTSGTYRLDGADVFHREEQELSRIRNREIGFTVSYTHLDVYKRQTVPSTAILPSVRVPVLSRHRTSTRASVSMQKSSWTRVFLRPKLMTPTASAMLMSSTSPSGIIPSTAATVLTIA